ncbi:methyl-accepting chemotaxis protein [Leptospira sp. 'Mane']|uniref:methyl-accepting chemotaxis protein n=1 Tax=Leptospira sp. 'Mane' TaxID=3387407 RepID=UPI00398B6980
MIKSISLKLQLMAIIFVLLTSVLTISFFISYENAKAQVLDVGGEMFTNVLKDSVGFIDALNERVKAGDLTLEEAQEIAKVYIVGPKLPDGTRDISKTKMSTNDYMYLWASHPTGTFTMHPFNVEKVNLWDYQINGKYTVRDTWSNPKATGRVVRELWQNAGEPIYYFIAYQAYYQPWDWVVGAGGREEIIYERRLQGLKYIFIFTNLVSLIFSLIVSYIFANLISSKINKIMFVIDKAGEGDLTHKTDISFKDEFGQLSDSFNFMTSNLRSMIGHVAEASVQVAKSSKDLYSNAKQSSVSANDIASKIIEVEQGAENQLQAFSESKRAMDENSQAMQKIAEATSTVSSVTSGVLEKVQNGRSVVSKTIQQMQVVNSSVAGISSSIHTLGENSKQIGEIVGTISQIASQTNLLALNAAIEAARAGEHGKGFAVVADEVRKLAEKSESATKQITDLIGKIQKNTIDAIGTMENGSKEVEQGVQMVNQVGETFQNIVSSIESVTEEMQSVSATTEEVSASTEELNASTMELAHISNRISENTKTISKNSHEQLRFSEDITASANSLNLLSEDLQTEINKFKT